MSPEAQRIAIGMTLGARWFQSTNGSLMFRFPNLSLGCVLCDGPLPDCSNPKYLLVPDYPADLNAMHEAEEVLGGSEIGWAKYGHTLYGIIEMRRHALHATAAQRAEAFLKTLNLWDETK